MAGKGGKRPGAGRPKAQHTIEKEAAKAQLIADYIANIKPINEALIKKAKSGDIAAIKELHDRVYGKAPQAITGPDGERLVISFDNSFSATARKTEGDSKE